MTTSKDNENKRLADATTEELLEQLILRMPPERRQLFLARVTNGPAESFSEQKNFSVHNESREEETKSVPPDSVINWNKATSLLHAAHQNIATLAFLSSMEAKENKSGEFSPFQSVGITSLCCATREGDINAIDSLLASGIPVDGNPAINQIPLFITLYYRDTTLFDHILAAGASIKAKCLNGTLSEWVGLSSFWAISDKQKALAFLAGEGVFLPPILLAACLGDNERVLLEARNGHLWARDGNGNGVFHYACANAHLSLAKQLKAMDPLLATSINEGGSTAFLSAAQNGNISILQWMLKEGLENKANHGSATALLLAAANGHLSTVQWLLKEGGSKINETDQHGQTALIWAAQYGHFSIVKWLIKEGGAKITEKSKGGMTVLLWASHHGYLSMFQWLLEEGEMINFSPTYHFGPFIAAAHFEEQRKRRVALRIKDADSLGRTALLHAALSGHLPIVEYLLTKGGTKITEADQHGVTALLFASSRGQLSTVRWLLKETGSKVTETDQNGVTPLLYAANSGHLQTTQWLLQEGEAKINEVDKQGITPLLAAAQRGHLPTIKWLLETAGSKITESDRYGMTALLRAAANGHLTTVQWLLREGEAKITEADSTGMTALHWAAREGYLSVVQWLLKEERSKINEVDEEGRTPMLLAAIKGELSTIQWLLKEGGASITEANRLGMTALHLAAYHGHLALAEWLLKEGGAKITEKDVSDETPLIYAAHQSHPKIIRFLLRKGAQPSGAFYKALPPQSWLRLWVNLYEAMTQKQGHGIHSTSSLLLALSPLHRIEAIGTPDGVLPVQPLRDQIAALKTLLTFTGKEERQIAEYTVDLLLSKNCEPLLTSTWIIATQRLGIFFTTGLLQHTDSSKKHLTLSHCQWNTFNRNYLFGFCTAHGVVKLTLTYCDWPTDPDWRLFLTDLVKLPLSFLDLSANKLSPSRLASLGVALASMANLYTCILDQNNMDYEGLKRLILQISRHPKLCRLSIRENHIEQPSKESLIKDIIDKLADSNLSLGSLDLTGNYLMSARFQDEQVEAIRLFLKTTGLTVEEFCNTRLLKAEYNVQQTAIFTLQIKDKVRDFPIEQYALNALKAYRGTKFHLYLDTQTLQDLQEGLAQNLQIKKSLCSEQLSALETKKEQRQLCKQMLFYRCDAPLKAYLKISPLFHAPPLSTTQALLWPAELLTLETWHLYFVVKHTTNPLDEHVMLAWEGIQKYGQHMIKVAHLQTRWNSRTRRTDTLVDYWSSFEVARIESFRTHHQLVVFKVSKEQIRKLQTEVEEHKREGVPGKYKMVISNPFSKTKEEETEFVTNCQKWALDRLKSCLDWQQNAQMCVLPSYTCDSLKRQFPKAVIIKCGSDEKATEEKGHQCSLM